MSAAVLDVDLIRRLLARNRPMAEIIERTGTTEEQVKRVARNFTIVPVKKPADQMDWEPHKDELRRLYFEGHTSTVVAERFGVTRNSVIGAWSRMNLPKRNKSRRAPRPPTAEEFKNRQETRRQQRAERKRAAAAAKGERRTQGAALAAIDIATLRLEQEPAAQTAPLGVVPILVRENGKLVANDLLKNSTCRWWVGDPVDPNAGFCPHKAVVGLPYCEHHAARAFQPPAARRQRTATPVRKPERIPSFADAD